MEFTQTMKIVVRNPNEEPIEKGIGLIPGDRLVDKIKEAYGDELKPNAIIDCDGGGLIRRRLWYDKVSGVIADVLDLPIMTKRCWGVTIKSGVNEFYIGRVYADTEDEVKEICNKHVKLTDMVFTAIIEVDPYALVSMCGGIRLLNNNHGGPIDE